MTGVLIRKEESAMCYFLSGTQVEKQVIKLYTKNIKINFLN